MTSFRVDWEPFIESLHEAARPGDRGAAGLREVDGGVDANPPKGVPNAADVVGAAPTRSDAA
ncbi:hypothetical protein ABTZ99_07395 [Actinosynnema sp. NPDC002837]